MINSFITLMVNTFVCYSYVIRINAVEIEKY